MGLQSGREVKSGTGSLCKGGKAVEFKSVFGVYSDAELVAQLKALALDPCNSHFSRSKIKPLWNQTLRLRKAMALSDNELPRRKRKLQQFVKEKLKTLPGSASGLSSQENHTKLSRGLVSHVSSSSCLFNSVESAESFDQKIILDSRSSNSLLTFEGNFLEKQISSESSFMGDGIKCNSPGKDISPLLDSDESVNCSDPLTPENLIPQEVPSLNTDGIIPCSKSLVLDKLNQKHLEPPRRSIRLLNFIGDHLQRMVVPVGPRFQADVPSWSGPFTEASDSERWLGTQIWPMKDGNTKITAKTVGKGRPGSCSCLSPGSTQCTKRHILEERLLLQCDLGSAFFSWKFDEMGEQVSKSWTLEEQHNFESLARAKPLSNGKDFLKHALKCFPYKCRKSIINYYFNVFIPRRMSLQTRSSLQEVDIDDDEAKNFNYLGVQKNFEGRTSLIGSPKEVKTRYLRQPF